MAGIFIIRTGDAEVSAFSDPLFALAGHCVAVMRNLAQLPSFFKMEKSQIMKVFVLDLQERSGALGCARRGVQAPAENSYHQRN